MLVEDEAMRPVLLRVGGTEGVRVVPLHAGRGTGLQAREGLVELRRHVLHTAQCVRQRIGMLRAN